MEKIEVSYKSLKRLGFSKPECWDLDKLLYHITEFLFFETEKWERYVDWVMMGTPYGKGCTDDQLKAIDAETKRFEEEEK